MRDSTPTWLRLLTLGLFLLLLAGAAGASLALIHLRQEEGRLAAATVKLRGDFSETSRRLEEMYATVAAAVQPATLRARIGTRLVPMTDKQIVWVRPGAAPSETGPASAPAFTFTFASAQPARTPRMLQ